MTSKTCSYCCMFVDDWRNHSCIGSKEYGPSFYEDGEVGVKNDDGKPRCDLLPGDVLLSVSGVLTHGAETHAPRNWELGMDWGRPLAAALRHIFKWMMGAERDEEGLSHLDCAICELLFLRAYEIRKIGKDDRKC